MILENKSVKQLEYEINRAKKQIEYLKTSKDFTTEAKNTIGEIYTSQIHERELLLYEKQHDLLARSENTGGNG